MLTTCTVTLTEVILVRDGRRLTVALTFVGRDHCLGYSRADIDTDWLLTLMVTVGMVAISGSHTCRLRLEDGAITEIGHPRENLWWDPRSDDQRRPVAVELERRRVAQALSHINKKRALIGQLKLAEAKWKDDDVIAEALRTGWDG